MRLPACYILFYRCKTIIKAKVWSLDKYKRKYKNINTDSKHHARDYHCANSRDTT